MRPPFETFKHPTCRGSYALGSACGRCEKCEWERGLMLRASFEAEQIARDRRQTTLPDHVENWR